MSTGKWVDEVLDFWFGELTREDWYSGTEAFDEKIRTRFGDLHRRLAREFDAKQVNDARTALATVIVFDQFPRNLYRRTAEAFSTDALALEIARRALDRDFDAGLDPQQKQFLYMPFMHSEVSADQERCIDLFKQLENEEGVRYAIEHRDIIERFGRFPHRNRALDRTSTPEEIAFLQEHKGYGQ